MDVVILILALLFSATAISLAVIFARSLERIARLSKVNRLEELEEKPQPTSVRNPLKDAMIKAYTMED